MLWPRKLWDSISTLLCMTSKSISVDLGFAHKTDVSAQTFTHYIAESQHQSFLENIFTSNFYSFIMEGSTDTGNVEDKLVLVQYCTQNATAQEMRLCVMYLLLDVPTQDDID